MSLTTSHILGSYRMGIFLPDSFPFINFLHCFLGVFCRFNKIASICICHTYTLNKYVHVFGTKGSKTAPTHKEKLFQESNCIDESHISQFLAFRKFSIFLDTLYHFLVHFRAKCHKTRLAFIFQNSKFQKDWMDSLELRATTVENKLAEFMRKLKNRLSEPKF